MNMINTVPRNLTVRFSRIGDDHHHDQKNGWRIFSSRRSNHNLMSSWSYRQDRARKRLIFLQSYKLGPVSSGEKVLRSRKLKKIVVTVKSAVVAALRFVRGGAGAGRTCGSRPAIAAASPDRVVKLC